MSNTDIILEYDIPELYPPVSELMIALQDEGKQTFDKKGVKLLTYSKLHKFSLNLHNSLVARNIKGMDSSKVPNDVINKPGTDNMITPSSKKKEDLLLRQNDATQQMNTFNDSASKYIEMEIMI
jgi:hypothetical protein